MKIFIRVFITIIFAAGQSSYCQWSQTDGPQGGIANCLERVGTSIWAGMPNGIYVSNNEGQSWQKLAVINSHCSDILSFNDTVVVVYQELIGYQSPDVNIYTITSFDAGSSWSAPTLISSAFMLVESIKILKAYNKLFINDYYDYYSSTNWGSSWNLLTMPSGYINALQASDNKLLLTNSITTSPYYAYYYSDDGAQSWQFVDSTYQISGALLISNNILFTISYFDTIANYAVVRSTGPATPFDTVFVQAGTSYLSSLVSFNGNVYVNASPAPNYMSNDSGMTWNPSPGSIAEPYFFECDLISLNNGDILGYDYPEGIIRIVPSQNTLFPTNTGVAGHATYLCRQHNNVLYASTIEALFRSDDAGQTWMPTDYPAHVLYSIDPAWDVVFKGDTGVAVSNNRMGRSFDNGITWDSLPCPGANSPFYVSYIEELNGRLFYSGDSMFYSDDLGITWNSLPPLPASTNCTISNADIQGYIKVFQNELYASSNSGYIYKFDTISQSWNYLYCFYSPGTSNGNYLYGVDSLIVMAGRMELSYSADNGATWTPAALNGLPIQNFYPVVPRSLVSINGIWFGTCGSYGVYSSNDQGDNWSPAYNGNSPFFSSGGLTVLNNVLFAGSRNNSMWTRGGNFQNISGTVYHDDNNNGVQDGGETGYAGIVVRISAKGWMATTDSAGHYTITTDAVGDTLKAGLPAFFAVSNPSYYLTNGAATGRDFGIYIPPNVADIAVDVTNGYAFVPGFSTWLNLSVHNHGSLAQPASLTLILDTLLDYISAFPAPASVSGDTLTWQSDTLQFLESQNIQVTVETPATAFIGDSVICFASALPVINDTLPSDNYAELRTTVMAAFDPNEKECLQGEYFTPAQLMNNEEMVFIVRFQNTGNFPATFVHVIDTLSPYLDLTTFRIVAASHTVTYSLTGFGIAQFNFDNINLPPSSVDEPNSHGFVKYGVHCKSSVVTGNAVVNTAHIYFDFNPPVATNSTTTLVAYPNPVFIYTDEPAENKNRVRIYPNPSSELIHLDLGNAPGHKTTLVIFNSEGKILQNLNLVQSVTSFSIREYAKGMYFGIIFNNLNQKLNSFRFVKN